MDLIAALSAIVLGALFVGNASASLRYRAAPPLASFAEIAIAVSILLRPQAGAFLALCFVSVATPIGLRTIRRTGSCGCGALDTRSGRALFVRNGAIVLGSVAAFFAPDLRPDNLDTWRESFTTVVVAVAIAWVIVFIIGSSASARNLLREIKEA